MMQTTVHSLFPEYVAGYAIQHCTIEGLECARCIDPSTLSDVDLMDEESMMRRVHALARNQRWRIVFPDVGPTGSVLVSEWSLWRLEMVLAEIGKRKEACR